jgi:hypothetical protein
VLTYLSFHYPREMQKLQHIAWKVPESVERGIRLAKPHVDIRPQEENFSPRSAKTSLFFRKTTAKVSKHDAYISLQVGWSNKSSWSRI